MKQHINTILNGGIRVEGDNGFISSKYREFISDLAKQDVELTLAGSIGDSSQKFCDYRPEKNIAIQTLGVVPDTKFLKVFYYFQLFFRSLFQKEDAFNYIFFPGNLAMALLPGILLRKKRYALYLRGQVRYRNPVLNWCAQKALEKAEFIIATGAATALFAKKFNKNVEEVVPMMSVAKDNLYRRSSFALSQPVRILYLSRIERDKGIYETVTAVKRLIAAGHNIVLDIAGGGTDDDMRKLKEMTSPMKEQVNILGQISDNSTIHQLFRNADMYLFPSYHEGFPRVLYEAMTFSVPIVTTDIPGTAGVMKDSENCLKVKPKSDEGLETAVEKLLKDEALRKTIGLNGYAFMEKYFSKIEGDSHAKQLLRWMEKVDL